MEYKYIFGPVPSRRLGISLGIDLIPFKTCSLNCVYCECGATTNLTIKRQEYVPLDKIFEELDDFLKREPELDFITFSGSGEPTLHNGIGEVIKFIKTKYSQYKIAVLTNGTLLSESNVRNAIINADLIMPSLDAVTQSVFKRLNRPFPGLNIQEIIYGLIKTRMEFSGQIYLEVFIVPGLNDTDSELTFLKKALTEINSDKIQLNTLDRPGTSAWVRPSIKEELERIANFFKPLPVEIIANFQSRKNIKSYHKDIADLIISTLKRRPCTAEDLANTLGLHINEINKYIQSLLENDVIESEILKRGIFFRAKNKNLLLN